MMSLLVRSNTNKESTNESPVPWLPVSWNRSSSLGGDRGRGSVYVRSTSNRVEILCTAAKDAKCRYCCKSPKLPAANFSAVEKSDQRPPVDVASITLPRSPASLSSGDEVPHIFTRKSRVQPKEILIASAKRLLQQYLPIPDQVHCSKRRAIRSHRRPRRAIYLEW
jgi:hypothetical protein